MNVVNNSNAASSGTAGLSDSQKRAYSGASSSSNGSSFSDVLRNLDDIRIRIGNPADDLGIAQPVQPSPQATPADKPPSEQEAAHTPEGPSETQRQEARAAKAAQVSQQPAPAQTDTPEPDETQAAADADCNATPTAQTANTAQADADADAAAKAGAPESEEQGRAAHIEPVTEPSVRKARSIRLPETGNAASVHTTALHNPTPQDPALAQTARQTRVLARDAKAADTPAADAKPDTGSALTNVPRKGGPATARNDARVADQRADVRADAQAAPARDAAQSTPATAAIASFASELRSALGDAAPRGAAADAAPTVLGALAAAGGTSASVQANSSPDASAAAALVTLSQPLDDAGFAAELGAKLSVLTQDGVQHAELHLNPAEMGPVAVQISVDGQQAQVSFHAAHAATRSALEQSLPDLAAALSAAGFTLSGGGVFQQSQGGQTRQDGGQAGTPNAKNERMASLAGADASAANAGISNTARRGGTAQALVDLYA